MSLNFADIVILGDDLSGIAVGSILAKRGLNILVVDKPQPGKSRSFPGLENRLFKSLVNKIGIQDARMQELTKNRISFQVILPDHRLDIVPTREGLAREFEREFPEHVGWVEDLFSKVEAAHDEKTLPLLEMIPWRGWREKRRFKKQKEEYNWPQWATMLQKVPRPIQALFKAWILFLTNNPTGLADAIQPFSLLTSENSSTVTVKGGWQALKRLFFEKIEYYGGTILSQPPADYRLETESSRIKGVVFDGYHLTTRCHYLVANDNLSDLASHMPKTFRTRRYLRRMKPNFRQYTIRFLTSSKILPEPMCQDVLMIQDPSLPLVGSNYLQIQVSPLAHPPDEREDTIIEVSYFLPTYETSEETEGVIEAFERKHEEIESSLRELIPFSKGSLQRIFPRPPSDYKNPLDDPMEDYSLFLGSARKKGRYTPSFNFPGLLTPYNNLYALGPDQMGWLGLEGRLHGTMKVIGYIWEKESKLRHP